MPFGPDHLKIKADLWLFFQHEKKARCCVCNKTKTGTFTCVNVVVLGCSKFLAGRMCEECFPKMKDLWERNELIMRPKLSVSGADLSPRDMQWTLEQAIDEVKELRSQQPVEVASTGKPRRIDSEGRDVTDLPGLWSETDKDIPQ